MGAAMAKLAQLPGFERASEEQTHARGMPRLRTRYYAFLSYSHRDKELADWLHRELERFRVPSALAGKLTANGVVPHRLAPIFRDEQDLSAGGELAGEIKAALAASQFLVVLCSPTAAKSRWTNTEIESFKRTRPEGCVLAAVAAGEPFASDIAGREDEECFPPALRYKYDRRGKQTTKRAEPLAADFRSGGWRFSSSSPACSASAWTNWCSANRRAGNGVWLGWQLEHLRAWLSPARSR
jgi:eukaryotic-like serine/threonine-protein kinase